MQQLQWKEQQKLDDIKERWGWRGFKCNGNKKQAGNGQKPLGMEEDCTIGIQSPQQIVAL
jgi:hypothetical protein